MLSLCVLGLGYIGLPTASIFATKGRRVLGVDVSASVVETINSGRIHIQELHSFPTRRSSDHRKSVV